MKKYSSAYTLIELIITLLIVAILALIAAPSMKDFVKNERLTGQINSVISNLMLARSEALKRNLPVVICASSDNATCTGSPKQGWIVFVDADSSSSMTSGDEIIQIQQALKGNVYFNGFGTITYDNRGFTPNSSGTITLCDDRGTSDAKVLTLSKTGRVRRSGTPTC